MSMIKTILVFLVSLLLIVGCSSASTSFDRVAINSGFQTTYVQGLNFRLTVYENLIPSDKGILHVYLGGDGTPWFEGRYVTDDPTPLNPIMLKLMKLDKTSAVYLGRPCYHQHNASQGCNKTLWTNKRYSPIVVDNMAVAINQYMLQRNFHQVKLFGFSGGGTLAMLLAPRITNISTVVTVAGNLDIDTWTMHHGYLPLTGSLNPAKQPPLPLHIRQLHLLGLQDKSVPPYITKPVINKQKNAQYIELKRANHQCCWNSIWSSTLSKISKKKK